jgi:uncharacterized damage-inducible protein DinB
MDDAVLRSELVNLLTQEQAHVQYEAALANVKRENRNRPVPGGGHTLWELLEHVRICQEDILRYTLDASWRSPETMEEYWPKPAAGAIDDSAWERSVKAFFRDRDEVARMATDRARDLTAKVPHGEFRTYLRQVLLVADHNAYHLAQIVQTRKALGDWPPSAG